jgi:F-type H+-transporting ATPase subunit delta
MTDVEKQYSRALFSLALQEQIIDDVYQELKTIIEQLNDDSWKFFLHPKIDSQAKHEVIEKISKQSLVKNFLKVLIDNNRFDLLETISYAYLDLINEMNEVVEVIVYSKGSLSTENMAKIKKNLETKLMKKIKIISHKDDSIIGGIRIEYQGNVIDQTINSSLQAMKETLLGGNSR